MSGGIDSDFISNLINEIKEDHDQLVRLAEESDLLGMPCPALIQYIFDRSLHLALLPRKFGGQGLDLVGEYLLIKNFTGVHPLLGWIVFQTCGNVGRVFSFFEDDEIVSILHETDGQPLICYHDNYHCGKMAIINGQDTLSGIWPYGSLARSATHFAAPFINEKGFKQCCLLRSNEVIIDIEHKFSVLRGSSTHSYEISNFKVDKSRRVRDIKCFNPHFYPYYNHPRALIKHAAFAVGFLLYVTAILEETNTSASTILLADIAEQVKYIKDASECLVRDRQEYILYHRDCDAILRSSNTIIKFNKDVHLLITKICCCGLQAVSLSHKVPRSALEYALLVATTMSSHAALRNDPKSLKFAFEIKFGMDIF